MTNAFPIKVFGARAVVKMDKAENKTLGGIIIPGAENAPVTQGTVMTTGEGMRLDNGTIFPMEVKTGDRVMIAPNAGSPVAVAGDDSEYLVINEAHVLAIIEG